MLDQHRRVAPVTVSIGISVRPRHSASLCKLIAAADTTMLYAKDTGKNPLVIAPMVDGQAAL